MMTAKEAFDLAWVKTDEKELSKKINTEIEEIARKGRFECPIYVDGLHISTIRDLERDLEKRGFKTELKRHMYSEDYYLHVDWSLPKPPSNKAEE